MYMSFGNSIEPFLFWGFVFLVLLRVVCGLIYTRVLKSSQGKKTTQVPALEVTNRGSIAVELGLPEATGKSAGGVSVVDVERSSD